MAQVIVRNIEFDVKAGLKQCTNLHGWSIGEEAPQIPRLHRQCSGAGAAKARLAL